MAAPLIDRDAMPVDRRRRRGADRSILGLLLIGLGLIWFLDETGLLALSAETILAIVLMLIGLGLILTARHGRKHWPIILGAIITLALIANSGTLSFPDMSSYGDQTFQPTAADLQGTYQTGVGRMTLDLRGLAAADGDRTVQVKHGVGQIVVDVPDGFNLHVDANVDVGRLTLCGKKEGGGPGVKRSFDQRVPNAKATLVLGVQQNVGAVNIRNCGSDLIAPPPPAPTTTIPTP